MARLLVVGGLAALAFAVYAIVDCALTQRDAVRALPRWIWVLLIVVLPVAGGVLWFLVGRGGVPAAPPARVTGPDDDPDFLRSTGRRRPAPPVADTDRARLEQEFAVETDQDDEGEGRRR